MDATALKLFASAALAATGVWLWWLLRPQTTPKTAAKNSDPPAAKVPAFSRHDVDRLLAPLRGRLRGIQERTRFSDASFERDCLHLVKKVAKYSRDAQGESSLQFMLDRTYHALGYRQAMLLPPEALPEDIEPRSYRWTFGVFVAAMLWELRSTEAPIAVDATAVTAGEELEQLLQPWLDPASLAWLLEDELLVRHLLAFMRMPRGATPLHQLVQKGHLTAGGEVVAAPALPVPAPPAAAAMPANEASVAAPLQPVAPDTIRITEALPSVPAPTMPPARVEPLTEAPKGAHAIQAESAQADALATTPRNTAAETPSAAPVDLPSTGQALAEHFMRWVAQGIQGGTLRVNQVGARVHFVNEGMVLATPGIFQEFALTNAAGLPPGSDPPAFAKEVQKSVCAAGWHLRGPQSAHLHRFRANQVDENGVQAIVKGVLIQNPSRFMPNPPAPTATLSRLM